MRAPSLGSEATFLSLAGKLNIQLPARKRGQEREAPDSFSSICMLPGGPEFREITVDTIRLNAERLFRAAPFPDSGRENTFGFRL